MSPTMISVMLFSYDDPHGTPRGMFSEKGVAWLLREDRALRAEDLFDKNRPWARALDKANRRTAETLW